jgi:hypothetical protein
MKETLDSRYAITVVFGGNYYNRTPTSIYYFSPPLLVILTAQPLKSSIHSEIDAIVVYWGPIPSQRIVYIKSRRHGDYILLNL